MRGSVFAPLHTGGFASHRRHENFDDDCPSSPSESSKTISIHDFCKFTCPNPYRRFADMPTITSRRLASAAPTSAALASMEPGHARRNPAPSSQRIRPRTVRHRDRRQVLSGPAQPLSRVGRLRGHRRIAIERHLREQGLSLAQPRGPRCSMRRWSNRSGADAWSAWATAPLLSFIHEPHAAAASQWGRTRHRARPPPR